MRNQSINQSMSHVVFICHPIVFGHLVATTNYLPPSSLVNTPVGWADSPFPRMYDKTYKQNSSNKQRIPIKNNQLNENLYNITHSHGVDLGQCSISLRLNFDRPYPPRSSSHNPLPQTFSRIVLSATIELLAHCTVDLQRDSSLV
jgi:hypothetical protein